MAVEKVQKRVEKTVVIRVEKRVAQMVEKMAVMKEKEKAVMKVTRAARPCFFSAAKRVSMRVVTASPPDVQQP